IHRGILKQDPSKAQHQDRTRYTVGRLEPSDLERGVSGSGRTVSSSAVLLGSNCSISRSQSLFQSVFFLVRSFPI
ncbi:hypothetical protein BGZ88_005762, partial [Linnemannia elongata]